MARESSRTKEHGALDTLYANIKAMDDLLIIRAKDALKYYQGNMTFDKRLLSDELSSFLSDRDGAAQDSHSRLRHLEKLPMQDTMWIKTIWLILDWADLTGDGLPSRSSWEIWAKKVYEAGKAVVNDASLCFQYFQDAIGPAWMHSVVKRLRLIDDFLGKFSRDHREELSKQLEEKQLEENLSAIAEIERSGENFDSNTIEYLMSGLRARKAKKPIGAAVPLLPKLKVVEDALDKSTQDTRKDDLLKPTTFAIMIILIMISIPFLAYGFSVSPHQPGTTHDADFWFLLPAALMQFVSLVPLVRSYRINPVRSRQVLVWIRMFISLSIMCTILAPILYCLVPTGWSALAAFFGLATSAFVILEAMLDSPATEKKTTQELA